jgi:enhancing lycopene biosynthesis protein 2
MAPNVDQMHVINHLTGKEVTGEKRNVLAEAARIARGDIKDISEVKVDDIDALIFPGGFGAAKNLCTMAVKGEDAEVHPEVSRLVKEFQNKQKPQAAVCIAPAMYAKIFEKESVSPTLTIGNDKDWSQKIENLGSKHQDCEVQKIVIDKENKIITSPAYMLGKSISEVAEGIEETVRELVAMV